MKEYTTSRHIAAPPARVWAVLVDAARYGDWNPEIVAIDGNIGPGQRITAHVRLGSGKVQKVGLRVTALDAPHLMEWTGGLPFGLFVGRRTFTVDSAASGCEFRLHLEMFGLLSGLIVKSVGDRQPEIDGFASGLKARAEATL